MAKKKRKETMAVEGEWPVGAYIYKAGRYLDDFVEGLKEKRIVGSVCTGCGRVYVRPRYICGRCMRKIDELTTISDRGTLTSYSITEPVEKGMEVFGMDPIEMGFVEEGERIILACVQFDGADGALFNVILMNADPEDVHVGMRVKVAWREETKGEMADFIGVEPVGGE